MKKFIFAATDLFLSAFYACTSIVWVTVKRTDASSYYPGDMTDEAKLLTIYLYPVILLLLQTAFAAVFWIQVKEGKLKSSLLFSGLLAVLVVLIYSAYLYEALYR